MKILIVEDEVRIAKLLEKLIREVWEVPIKHIHKCHIISEAKKYLIKNPIDLMFLDLNLQGQNGFDLLKEMSAQPFHTVIVSAYKEKALEAFEYGVLDFIPKPFNRERLEKTYQRLCGKVEGNQAALKFISIKKTGKVLPIPVKDVSYIQANGHYAAVHLSNGEKLLCDKSLERLEILLPLNFLRIHRSYLVNLNEIREIQKFSGSKYQALLKDDTILPVGRSRIKALESRMI